MMVFPRQQLRRKKLNPVSEQEIIPVYCSCRLPRAGKMVVCTVGSAMKKSLVTDSAGWCFSVYSASTRI